MSRVFSAFLAAVFWSVVCAAQAPPPLPPGFPAPPRDISAQPSTAIIRGHVFDAATGQPLRKAQVRAISPEIRENRLSTTDNNGAYEIKELPAGRYQLNASKGSFVQLQYGQTRPFEAGKPLQISNGQTIEKVDFSLPRGGVITGRIVDETGEATADVQVMAMRYQYIQGRRQLTPVGRQSTTNDIGEFRIFALPPGQYYISATLRSGINVLDTASTDRAGYAPTYFPNTPNVAEAQRVTVAVGQTLSDLNIALSPTRLARVSGTAVDSEGKPLVSAIILMIQTTGFSAAAAGANQVRPDGSFSIANVSPGDYILRAQGPTGLAAAGAEVAQANVTVAGEDINGLRITGVKPSTVTGRVVVAGADTPGAARGLQLFALPASNEFGILTSPGIGRINDDGTFEMKLQPGRQLIRQNSGPGSPQMAIKAVRLNGVDVTDGGIDVRANEDISGVELELTSTLSDVSGSVAGARNEPVKDFTVVMFARDRQRWGFASRYVNMGRPDQDGKYKVRGLPPGEYYAIALDYIEPGEVQDPEFLDRIKDRATEFSLGDGEARGLDLKLVAAT